MQAKVGREYQPYLCASRTVTEQPCAPYWRKQTENPITARGEYQLCSVYRLGKKIPAGGSGVRGGVKKEVTRDTVWELVH